MQTRRSSILEAILGTASGFIVAMLVWQLWVAPLFGYHVTIQDNFWLTMIFTVVSIVRVYIWRRIFNYFTTRRTK